MDAMTLLPHGRPLTRDDLDALPDDGHRYELIDGVLVVTPAPSPAHQDVVFRLARVLDEACPPELKVFLAPFEVTLALDRVLQPDVLVARRDEVTERGVSTAPVLAVEILSPSTRRFDLITKRDVYQDAGTPSYWVVDPIDLTLTAWDLVDGTYVEVGNVTGEEELRASSPFSVTVVPALLRD